MLSNDLKFVNVGNKVEIHLTRKFKNRNFQYIFLNWIISVILFMDQSSQNLKQA